MSGLTTAEMLALGLVGGGGALFSPPKIPGLALWLNADDLTGNDGDAVISWASKEGNAYDFAQATGAKQPALKKALNGIGGHNVVRFGGDDLLVLPSAPLTGAAGTVFAVYRLSSSPTDYQHILSSCDEASVEYTMRIMAFNTAAAPNIAFAAKTTGQFADEVRGSTSVAVGTIYTNVWQSNGSAYAARVNGAAQTMTAVAGGNNGNWFGDVPERDSTVIGALKRTTEAAFFKGDLAELIAYSTELSAAEIEQVETYLNNKYNWVSVQSFGAVADGVTNASPAFQAAINALAGTNKSIYAPAGTYKIGTTLDWKSGVNMIGDGIDQTILSLADAKCIQATGTLEIPIADCNFRDFTVNGAAHTGWYKGFFVLYCLRHTYTRVKVANTGATGFGSDYMVDCAYTDCIADNCGQAMEVVTPGCSGFGIGTGKYAVENVTLTNCTATGNKRYGVFFEAQGSGAGWFVSQGARIVGGSSSGNQWGIGDLGVDGMLIDGVTIQNNIAEGIYVGGPGIGGPGVNGIIRNCEVSGNGALGIRPETGGVGYTLTNNNVHDNGA
jgi:hypothetical protein